MGMAQAKLIQRSFISIGALTLALGGCARDASEVVEPLPAPVSEPAEPGFDGGEGEPNPLFATEPAARPPHRRIVAGGE